jgi:hypothetical protein
VSPVLDCRQEEYKHSIEPARALAAETLKLERPFSGLVNQACGVTPTEIELTWTIARPRMSIAARNMFAK